MDVCPLCKTAMTPDTAIGPFCGTLDCPVIDDALLWYQNAKGEWKRQQWIKYDITATDYELRLSEKEL